MAQTISRNFEDGYGDPEILAVQYRTGRNAFFEVQLTLGELVGGSAAVGASNGGMLAGNPTLFDAIGIGEEIGCPETSQWIRTADHKPIRVGKLVGKEGLPIYNPITRNFNKLKKAELHKDVPLVLITAGRAKNLVSDSHQIITRPFDRVGENLRDYQSGDVLTFDDAVINRQKNFNIYQDLFTIEPAGRGDVVEIALESEYIYVSGMDKDSGVVAHNEKPEGGLQT